MITITLWTDWQRRKVLEALVYAIETLEDACRMNESDSYIQLENDLHQRNQCVFRAPARVWQSIDAQLGLMVMKITDDEEMDRLLELQNVLLLGGALTC